MTSAKTMLLQSCNALFRRNNETVLTPFSSQMNTDCEAYLTYTPHLFAAFVLRCPRDALAMEIIPAYLLAIAREVEDRVEPSSNSGNSSSAYPMKVSRLGSNLEAESYRGNKRTTQTVGCFKPLAKINKTKGYGG